jgi:hypothetical protein
MPQRLGQSLRFWLLLNVTKLYWAIISTQNMSILIHVPDANFTASLMVFSCAFEAAVRAGVDSPNRPDS